uniref:Protein DETOXIFICATION 9-like n=1 Tax=Nicotiana tabacum TaxID=4097 RepID=A0A1S4D6N7_TOBAC
SLLWIFTGKLLIWIGQDPSISVEAGKYSIWLISSLFRYAILQSLNCYFQTQSLILPMLWSSVVSLCFNLPLSWALIFKFKLGTSGAAMAIGLSYSLNVILLVLYLKYSLTCQKTRPFFSKDVFIVMPQFFQFAIPSAGMVCLTTSQIHFQLSYSFGAAASTRISNELGARNPKAARNSICAVFTLATVEFLIASGILFLLRNLWGYAFTHEQEVVNLLKEITPLLCLSMFLNTVVAVLSGAYYLVGIPASLLMGFVLNWRAKGMWSGIIMGSIVQTILLSIVTCLSDWEKQ